MTIKIEPQKRSASAMLALLAYLVALVVVFLLSAFGPDVRPSRVWIGFIFGVGLGLASVAAIWIAWGNIALSHRFYIGAVITFAAVGLMTMSMQQGGGSSPDRWLAVLPFGYCAIAMVPLFVLRIKYGFQLTRRLVDEPVHLPERYQFSIRRLIEFTTAAGVGFLVFRFLSGLLVKPSGGPSWIEIAGVMLAMICSSVVTAWLSIILSLGTRRTLYIVLILCLLPPIGLLESLAVRSLAGSGPELNGLFMAKVFAQFGTIVWPLIGLHGYGLRFVRASSPGEKSQ